MRHSLLPVVVWAALAASAEAQDGGMGCCGYGMGSLAGAPLQELRGKIVQVRIAPGLGMPAIVVKAGDTESVVLLGPLRYLMAQNFNPKVGDEVAIKAFKTGNGLMASSVTVGKKTLRLREQDGQPVWRGGRW